MTPKEKAIEIVTKYKQKPVSVLYVDNEGDSCIATEYMLSISAKACALIAVDEIIEALSNFGYVACMYDDFESGLITTTNKSNPEEYWQQVKYEINK